jgi:hypothetical protein
VVRSHDACSAHLTSPFEFYQYFVQLSDATALRLLPQLALLDARSRTGSVHARVMVSSASGAG